VLAQQLSDPGVNGRGASVHPLNDGLEHWNRKIEKFQGAHGLEINQSLPLNIWCLFSLFVLLTCIWVLLSLLFFFMF
jgi:hypothetical protein